MTLLRQVLRQAHGLSHAAHLVLLALAAYMEEHGAPVYPSQATLANDCGVTERYIEACVKECEQAGYLHVERRREPGKRPRNFYTVLCRWRTIPEQASGNLVPRTAFPEPSSVETQEKEKELQEHGLRGKTFPEPASPNSVHPSPAPARLTPHGEQFAQMLARSQVVTPDFAQTTLRGATISPTRKPRGEGLYKLGKLCKRGHDHDGTGKSLRRLPSGSCLHCDMERQEAKRQNQVRAHHEARGPRRIVNMEEYRASQDG